MNVIAIISTIAAIVTVVTATAAPIISSIITQRGSYRQKLAEFYFTAKMDAYTKFLHTTSCLSHSPSTEDLKELNSVTNLALVFSTESTGRKIIDYTDQLNNWTCNESLDSKSQNAFSNAYLDMISAIHREMDEYRNQ